MGIRASPLVLLPVNYLLYKVTWIMSHCHKCIM